MREEMHNIAIGFTLFAIASIIIAFVIFTVGLKPFFALGYIVVIITLLLAMFWKVGVIISSGKV